MDISSSTTANQGDQVLQAVLLRRAIKLDEVQQLTLIESANLTGPTQPADSGLVGRVLNEKA